MKIGIYSPYLDAVGGGEKYILTVAECLSKDNQVDLLLDRHLQSLNISEILAKMTKLHNLDLKRIHIINAPISKADSLVKKSLFLKQFDWLFYNSDGSLFYSTAKNSIVHFQIPFEKLALAGLKGKIKMSSWKLAIYNSNFTKEIVEKNLKLPGSVIYPPVNIEDFHSSSKKKKQILTVGRLVGSGVKKQKVMIEVFIEMVRSGKLKDWSFYIAGAGGDGDLEYIDDLKKIAQGFPIKFHVNLPFDDLVNLYSESMIYWHAMGYGESDPKKMEHFGITTVEAMASGVIPIVINRGGQKEIVDQGVSGFLWDSLEELKQLTTKVIEDQQLVNQLSKAAITRSKFFSKAKFTTEIERIVNGGS